MTYQESLVALADPTRRAVYAALVRAPQPVGVLARSAGVSRPAVSSKVKAAGARVAAPCAALQMHAIAAGGHKNNRVLIGAAVFLRNLDIHVAISPAAIQKYHHISGEDHISDLGC